MQKIDPKEIPGNVIEMIGDRWMLITAGDIDNYNTMTASWGTLGFLWNMPIATIFIRPQRHTYLYCERSEKFTLSFFGEQYRSALQICGTVSGRDTNKALVAGLSPVSTENGYVSFAEADLVIECRKIYAGKLSEDKFTDKTIVEAIYPTKDFHKMYIGEILSVSVKEII